MSDPDTDQAPDAAVQIVAREVAGHHYGVRDVCNALARRYAFVDHVEYARLVAQVQEIRRQPAVAASVSAI